MHHFFLIDFENCQANSIQYLLALDEEDIPNSQSKLEGHVAAEERHEPLGGVERWHEVLFLQVHVEFGHVLLQQDQEHVKRGFEARHSSFVEFFHLVLLAIYDFQHDTESVFFVDVSEKDGRHVAHTLYVAKLRLDDAEALQNGEEILLAMVELLLEIDMIWKRSRNVLVYF